MEEVRNESVKGVNWKRIGYVGFFFFFQAEDGIRDWSVTGVQTCALPISSDEERALAEITPDDRTEFSVGSHVIYRAGCTIKDRKSVV